MISKIIKGVGIIVGGMTVFAFIQSIIPKPYIYKENGKIILKNAGVYPLYVKELSYSTPAMYGNVKHILARYILLRQNYTYELIFDDFRNEKLEMELKYFFGKILLTKKIIINIL